MRFQMLCRYTAMYCTVLTRMTVRRQIRECSFRFVRSLLLRRRHGVSHESRRRMLFKSSCAAVVAVRQESRGSETSRTRGI